MPLSISITSTISFFLVICDCKMYMLYSPALVSQWVEVELFLPSLCGLDCRSADTISVTDSCEGLIRHTMANTDFELSGRFLWVWQTQTQAQIFYWSTLQRFHQYPCKYRHSGKITSKKSHNWTQTEAKTISNIVVTFLYGIPSPLSSVGW